MSLVLNVEILGEFKKLTSATQGAQGSLNGLNKKATAISKSMNRAFAAIGIGLSFRAIANELEQATVAAIEDRKSMQLLALAMQNTADATDEQIASAEKSITKLSLQAGVADDKLRPAYQKLFLATKDVTKSQDLLAIALDASAATGKDLDTVSQAMAKALAGSDTALVKLIPSLKGSKTPIEDMAAAFKGAATEAANLDPYQKMQVAFGEIQEKLGSALLPVLDKFSAWLASPGGQQQLDEIVQSATEILTALGNVAMWALENKDWLLPLAGSALIFGGVVKAIQGITTAINAAKSAQLLFNAAAAAAPGATTTGVTAPKTTAGKVASGVAKTLTWLPIIGGLTELATSGEGDASPSITRQGPVPKLTAPPVVKTGATNNVTVNINTPKVNAQDIVNTLNNATKNGFTGNLRALKE
jgi:hypothetical protein